MTKKIFRSTLLVAVCALLASLVLIMGCLYDYFAGLQSQALRDELTLAASGVSQGGETYLDTIDSNRYRLTWIAPDGTVLYDTQADASTMENHASREEVQQALAAGEGESSRYSQTLLEKTIYVARRMDDGSVLRICVSRQTLAVLLLGMLQPVLVILLAAVIFSALLAKRLSHRIVEVVLDAFRKSDMEFDEDDIRLPLQNVLNELSSPEIRFDYTTYIDKVESQFPSGYAENDDIHKLKSLQTRLLNEIDQDMGQQLTAALQMAANMLNKQAVTFADRIQELLCGELEKLQGQIQERETYLAAYQQFDKTIQQMKKQLAQTDSSH